MMKDSESIKGLNLINSGEGKKTLSTICSLFVKLLKVGEVNNCKRGNYV